MNNRLQKELLPHNLYPIKQAGFQQGCSTEEQLAYMAHSTHSSFSNQHHLIAVSFDITKAFNTLWNKKIVEQFKEWGIDGWIPFIQRFLTEISHCASVTIHLPKKRTWMASHRDLSLVQHRSKLTLAASYRKFRHQVRLFFCRWPCYFRALSYTSSEPSDHTRHNKPALQLDDSQWISILSNKDDRYAVLPNLLLWSWARIVH